MTPGTAEVGTGTDAAIIAASRAQPERFAELFDRHAARIHRYVARRLGRDTAGDLVAETFLAAFGNRHRYDPGVADARPWLFGIATNLIGQHRRDEVRRYRLRLALPAEPTEDSPAERVAAGVSAQAVRGRLAEAVATLAAGDRDVLLLIAWEQFSYAEVAAALGIPVGTVRSRLNRARSQVRAALGGTNPTDAFDPPHEERSRWTT
jgi:RNA polymerase sigma-70 factor (ECF subfamily)